MTPREDPSQPLPPLAPEAGDCCQSGCDRCVLDIYQEALDRYQKDLEAWKQRLAGKSANNSP